MKTVLPAYLPVGLSLLILMSAINQSFAQTNRVTVQPPPPAFSSSGSAAIISADDILAAIHKEDTVSISVPNDPAYGTPHRYRAVSLDTVVRKASAIDSNLLCRSDLIFECQDGYRSVLSGTDINGDHAFLALSDLRAPADEDWLPIKKASGNIFPGPLYLVWTNTISPDDRPWPYQIARIKIVPGGDLLSPARPSADPMAQAGFNLFRKICLTCHGVNGVGGKVAVDLNYPLNVTEYWRKNDIKKLIRNPQSIRLNTKMPGFPQLTDYQIDLILAYLSDMKHHKLNPPDQDSGHN